MPNCLLGFLIVSLGLIPLASAKDTRITEREICPGVTYLHKTVADVPWSIHALRIDRHRPELKMVTTLSGGEYVGLTRLSDQVKFIPGSLGKPVGGINGDFFRWQIGPYQGDVSALHIVNGELISAPSPRSEPQNVRSAAALWMNEKGDARISFVSSEFNLIWPDGTRISLGLNEERSNNQVVVYNHSAGLSTKTTNGVELVLKTKGKDYQLQVGQNYQVFVHEVRGPNTLISSNDIVLSIGPDVSIPKSIKRGTALTISTATTPDLRGCTLAVGGGPVLVQNGKVAAIPHDEIRHPRGALGCSKDYFFFVVVDGRRPGISDGMTIKELAREMASWKCEEAMNVDGGASAMLWIDGKIMNLPSENRERPNANSLFVLRRDSSQAKVVENRSQKNERNKRK